MTSEEQNQPRAYEGMSDEEELARTIAGAIPLGDILVDYGEEFRELGIINE